jgi:hypothetical protein
VRSRSGDKAVHRAVTNADAPNLGIGQSREQAPRCGNHIVGHLVFARVDVDRHDFAVVAELQLCAQLTLVNCLYRGCRSMIKILRCTKVVEAFILGRC